MSSARRANPPSQIFLEHYNAIVLLREQRTDFTFGMNDIWRVKWAIYSQGEERDWPLKTIILSTNDVAEVEALLEAYERTTHRAVHGGQESALYQEQV